MYYLIAKRGRLNKSFLEGPRGDGGTRQDPEDLKYNGEVCSASGS